MSEFRYIVKRQAVRSKSYGMSEPIDTIGERSTPEEAEALADATSHDWARVWIEVERVTSPRPGRLPVRS